MNIKQELIGKLKEQLEIEILARNIYKSFVEKIKDDGIKQKISKIRDDEIEHIKIVDELIKTVENYKKPIREKIETAVKEIPNFFEKADVVLLLGRVEDYMYKLTSLLKELKERKIVYVSYNKMPKYTKKIFGEHGINLKDISFINCVSIESKEDISIRPEELTKLSIAIGDSVKKLKNPVLTIDTISAFSTYHSINTITQFVGSISGKARAEEYKILFMAMNEPSERELNSKISQLSDETVKL